MEFIAFLLSAVLFAVISAVITSVVVACLIIRKGCSAIYRAYKNWKFPYEINVSINKKDWAE